RSGAEEERSKVRGSQGKPEQAGSATENCACFSRVHGNLAFCSAFCNLAFPAGAGASHGLRLLRYAAFEYPALGRDQRWSRCFLDDISAPTDSRGPDKSRRSECG